MIICSRISLRLLIDTTHRELQRITRHSSKNSVLSRMKGTGRQRSPVTTGHSFIHCAESSMNSFIRYGYHLLFASVLPLSLFLSLLDFYPSWQCYINESIWLVHCTLLADLNANMFYAWVAFRWTMIKRQHVLALPPEDEDSCAFSVKYYEK